MRVRYCGVKSCPYFKGTRDPTVRFFRLPQSDPELLAKWQEALDRKKDSSYHVCFLHFREEDFIPNGSRPLLRKNVIPFPVPKTEVLQDPPIESVEFMDIEAITNDSEQQDVCRSCVNYEMELQAAYTKIALLEKRLSELTGNKMGANSQFQPESMDNLTSHQILCEDFVQLPENLDIETKPIETISIDEETTSDNSNLPNSLLAVKMEELSDSDVSTVSVTRPLEEIKSCNKLVQTLVQIPRTLDVSFQSAQAILKLFKCGICDEDFGLPKELKIHMQENHSQKSMMKNMTKTIQNIQPPRENHEKKKKDEKVFQCYLCKINFNLASHLRIHMKCHERDHRCEICKMELTSSELNSHLCGEEKSIRCDYCPVEFTATMKLLEHLKNTHDKKFYGCEKCPKFFAMIALKEYHMKTHEKDLPRPFRCETCSNAFASKDSLRTHIKTHMKKSHLCEKCGNSFSSTRNLELHRRSLCRNKDQPKLQCPDCPRQFIHKHNLINHSHVHRDDKYVCAICQLELISKKSYKKHIKIHKRTEEDRKYACKLCPKKFFASRCLQKHQRVHFHNLRLFSCRFCEQSYKYSGDLNKHLKTHLGGKIHECSKCSERFKYPIELQKHEFEHYKKEKEANRTTE